MTREQRQANQATHGPAVKHERCEIPYCHICDGGLFVCSVCGAAEIEAEERPCEPFKDLLG